MIQKPTVGREVHYYSNTTFWHRNKTTSPYAGADSPMVFDGPFAAKVVFVHPGLAEERGEVNLLICFPSACVGSSEKTELVSRAAFSEEPTAGCWSWPPRV